MRKSAAEIRPKESREFTRVWHEITEIGLLLESDGYLPSVASIIGRQVIPGSWWGHPRGHAIFDITRALATHPDMLVVKLVSGKVTYIHRRLWPPVLAIAVSRAPWQMRKLSETTQEILCLVEKRGQLRGDSLKNSYDRHEIRTTVRELERRLLIKSQDVHTESGTHAKMLESWSYWSKVKHVKATLSAAAAMKQMEELLAALNAGFGGKAKLPWQLKSNG